MVLLNFALIAHDLALLGVTARENTRHEIKHVGR
jgi:hypothetical protein